ncbi:endonuclease IV [Desulfuromonas soudanensis]|uniref:Probable endonuclease 4 n=1 Tax=Desulfuromonas soudanensis TaxID=1603606 RepID=A0A0M4CZ29_9BACT|nr:deoxyribonuclease IV [Desulfuromonas soudanensis]ALC17878.1 endonuclease IV [Desulfuromonas soudanensis]
MGKKTAESPLLIGAHMSISGGHHLAFARGEAAGCRAMQIFTKNANQWHAKPIDADAAAAFGAAWKKSPIGPVIAHDSYLINLASADEEKWQKSLAAFADEMERCAALGIGSLVMHPGAHLGAGEDAGLERIVTALRRIFAESPPSVRVLVENTAGQGTYLGGTFEHLAAILEELPEGRIGVCFDTCHAFAAGFDLSTAAGYRKTMDDFDRLVGLGRIAAFHINDSQKGLGCRVDRHAHIGQGAMGLEGFGELMRDPRFFSVPKILETPKGDDDSLDRMNLATLRRLATGG